MRTETVTLFLAMLAVVAQVAVVVSLVLLVAARLGVARDRVRAIADGVAPSALVLAAAVALVATVGSLWLSEGAGFPPCKLCWYQRIAMYPLSVVLAVAAWRRDAAVRRYVLPVAVIGAGISTYHVLLERFPSLEASGTCDPINPCTIRWVERFGYLTIPTMALSAFALIITLVLVAGREEVAP